MKCQILFSAKNKKTISKCHLLKILLSMLSVIKSSVLYMYSKATAKTEIQIRDNFISLFIFDIKT